MTPIAETFATPTRPRRADPDQQEARDVLSRVVSRLPQDGGDADDLKAVWRRAGRIPCPDCRGSGRVRGAYCTCLNGADEAASDRERIERDRAAQRAVYGETWERLLNAPPHIYAKTIADFPQKSARNAAQRFLTNWKWEQNLILFGRTGRGKTSLALTMAKALRDESLAMPSPRYVRFYSMTDLQRYLKAGLDASKTGHGASYEQRMDALSQCALLVCDDVGTERRTEWWPQAWFDILYARYNAGLPTWITTNLAIAVSDDGDIEGPFVAWLDDHGRLLSRLLERGAFIEVTGRDLRLKVAGAKSLA